MPLTAKQWIWPAWLKVINRNSLPPDGTGRLVLNGYNPATGEISYVYILQNVLDHAEPGNGNGQDASMPGDSFVITARDAEGTELSSTLDVSVLDDAPLTGNDMININKGALDELAAENAERSLFSNDTASADGQSLAGLSFDQETQSHVQSIEQSETGWDVVTDYGTLHVNNNGTYTFEPGDGFAGLAGSEQIKFSYTVRDGDGDESTAETTLNLYNQGTPGSNDAPQIITDSFASNDIVTGTGNLDGTFSMYSKVAALADGNYVVAWKNGANLYTQLYSPLGETIGEPALVTNASFYASSYKQYDYSDSFTVSAMPDGGYLVTWDNSNHSTGYGQVFDQNGDKLGSQMNMAANDYRNGNSTSGYNWANDHSTYTDSRDTIALENGGFVVIGHDNDGNYYNCNVAFLDANGKLASADTDFQSIGNINPIITTNSQSGHTFNGHVEEIGTDRIAVVYVHSAGSGSTMSNTGLEGSNYTDQHGSAGSQIFLGIYSVTRDAAGNIKHISMEQQMVQLSSTGTNKMPEICTLDGGRFAIVWQNDTGGSHKAKMQIFETDGQPAAGFETAQDVSDESGQQLVPNIIGLPDGGYMITWSQEESAGSKTYDILARRFDENGNPTGEAVHVVRGVESYEMDGETGTQRHPDVAILADGRMVITWTTVASLNGRAEVHHQIVHPRIFGGETTDLPTYVEGQDGFYPLLTAIAGMYDNDDDAPGEVYISLGNAQAGDLLGLDAEWCAANGISVQYTNNGTGLVISLAGSDLPAADQWKLLTEALQKVSYENTSPAGQVADGERSITVTVTDSKGASSTVESNFEVIVNNEAPGLVINGEAHLNMEIGESLALVAAGSVVISDKEYDDIAKADISIANYQPGVETLTLELPAGDERFAGITASFDAAAGVLTISGAASASVYQQVLSYLRYECTSDVPMPEDRVISIRISDANGLRTDSEPVTLTVTAEHPNAPLLTASENPESGAEKTTEGSHPLGFALADGGFALCVQTASGVEIKTFNANGTERADTFSLEGVDNVSSVHQMPDGGLLILGTDSGHDVLLQVGANGQQQDWDLSLNSVNDLAILPNGGLMVAGVENGRMVVQSFDPNGRSDAHLDLGAAPANANMEIALQENGAFALIYETAGGVTTVSFYNAQGQPTGETNLPQELVNSDGQVEICALDNGQYVVVWRSSAVSDHAMNASETLRAQVFNADGSPVGPNFVIDQLAHTTHSDLSISALEGGQFAVSWSSSTNGGAASNVYAGIWDNNGANYAVGTVPDAPAGANAKPDITALPDGGYVMSWQQNGEVHYSVFNADGSAREYNYYVSSNDAVSLFHNVDISDPDGSQISEAVISLGGYKAGDELFFDGFNPEDHGLTANWDPATGQLTLSGVAQADVYENALEALRFQNLNNSGVEGEREIKVVLTDDNADKYNSNTITSQIEVHDADSAISGPTWADNLSADTLTGGIESDAFIWANGNIESTHPALEIIADFDLQSDSQALNSLLCDYSSSLDSDDLAELLSIENLPNSTDAVINIHDSVDGQVVQQIVLQDALDNTSLEEIQAQIKIITCS